MANNVGQSQIDVKTSIIIIPGKATVIIKAVFFYHRVIEVTEKGLNLGEGTVSSKAIRPVSRRGAEFAVNTLDFGFFPWMEHAHQRARRDNLRRYRPSMLFKASKSALATRLD